MSDKIKLSLEDQAILHKLNNEQLRFLSMVEDHPQKEKLVEVLNLLIGREKEIFFQENSLKYTPEKLYGLHAMSRGTVAAYVTFFHILKGARLELERREKSKEEKK